MGSYALSKEEKAAPPAPAAVVEGFLAGAHDKESIPCEGCHGQEINALDDGEQLVNANCVGCHATLAELGKKAAGHINPHATHLGEIGCTVCHHGHVASRPYCLNCHDFELTIQAAEGKAVPHPAPKPRARRAAEQADVVVIGAGAAGFTAAITAHDAGAKVVLLEKQPITGGNSTTSSPPAPATSTSPGRSSSAPTPSSGTWPTSSTSSA